MYKKLSVDNLCIFAGVFPVIGWLQLIVVPLWVVLSIVFDAFTPVMLFFIFPITFAPILIGGRKLKDVYWSEQKQRIRIMDLKSRSWEIDAKALINITQRGNKVTLETAHGKFKFMRRPDYSVMDELHQIING